MLAQTYCYADTAIRDNWVVFRGVTIIGFSDTDHSITTGQPWEAPVIDTISNGIDIRAGRKGDKSNDKWLKQYDYSTYGDDANTNFAVVGTLTFTQGNASYSCSGVAFEQRSKNLTFRNRVKPYKRDIWFMYNQPYGNEIVTLDSEIMTMTCINTVDNSEKIFQVDPSYIHSSSDPVSTPVNSFNIEAE